MKGRLRKEVKIVINKQVENMIVEKRVCTMCYREFEVLGTGDICSKCKAILGKGVGYKATISDDEANKWFEGLEERKNLLKEQGKI